MPYMSLQITDIDSSLHYIRVAVSRDTRATVICESYI